MAKIVDEYFACDFCTVFCGHSYAYREDYCRAKTHRMGKTWFLVYDIDGTEPRLACRKCGHTIHFLLGALSVPHKFTCHEYADEDAPGEIHIPRYVQMRYVREQ